MALCLGGPNIADAVTDAPDSILGRIGLGIAGIASFFTGTIGIITGIIIFVVVLVAIYYMVQRQMVKF